MSWPRPMPSTGRPANTAAVVRAPAIPASTRAENRSRSTMSRCAARINVATPSPWVSANRQNSASRCQCPDSRDDTAKLRSPAATSAPNRARAATARRLPATDPSTSRAATSNAATGCAPTRSSPIRTSKRALQCGCFGGPSAASHRASSSQHQGADENARGDRGRDGKHQRDGDDEYGRNRQRRAVDGGWRARVPADAAEAAVPPAAPSPTPAPRASPHPPLVKHGHQVVGAASESVVDVPRRRDAERCRPRSGAAPRSR